jgi:hypothetical protein
MGRFWLLIHSGFLLVGIGVALWLFPLNSVQRVLLAHGRRRAVPPRQSLSEIVSSVRWAVEGISHRLLGSTCLERALAAQALLAGFGIRSELIIITSQRSAHARLECAGIVVTG